MKWEPIETAPQNGTQVLLFGKLDGEIHGDFGDPVICVGSKPHGQWYLDNTDCYAVYCEPTHWMPLPLPPQDQRQDEEERSDDTATAEQQIVSLTNKIASLQSTIDVRDATILSLEADREFMVQELGRLLEKLGKKDLAG